MKRSILFFLGIVCMVAVSRFIFERLHLYDEFHTLDIPMHILGGFLVYGFFDAVLRVRKQKVDFLLIVALFLLCATVWEINEFFVRQVVERSWYGVFDTVKDYFDGLLGLSVGYYFIHKRKKS